MFWVTAGLPLGPVISVRVALYSLDKLWITDGLPLGPVSLEGSLYTNVSRSTRLGLSMASHSALVP